LERFLRAEPEELEVLQHLQEEISCLPTEDNLLMQIFGVVAELGLALELR
jgi:hypothetical protein